MSIVNFFARKFAQEKFSKKEVCKALGYVSNTHPADTHSVRNSLEFLSNQNKFILKHNISHARLNPNNKHL